MIKKLLNKNRKAKKNTQATDFVRFKLELL
jgi:hypothetical protein